jgi:hypothetical protein
MTTDSHQYEVVCDECGVSSTGYYSFMMAQLGASQHRAIHSNHSVTVEVANENREHDQTTAPERRS